MVKKLLRIQAPLVGALVLVMAFIMFSGGTAHAAAPMNVTQEDLVGWGFHMNSNVNLGTTGQVDVITHTWTTNWGLGFTGGVFVLLRAADGTVIGATHLHTFGVDAKSIFWGRSSRYDYWSESVDPAVAAATTSIQIIQQQTPQDRLPSIIAYVESVYNQAHQSCINMGICH